MFPNVGSDHAYIFVHEKLLDLVIYGMPEADSGRRSEIQKLREIAYLV